MKYLHEVLTRYNGPWTAIVDGNRYTSQSSDQVARLFLSCRYELEIQTPEVAGIWLSFNAPGDIERVDVAAQKMKNILVRGVEVSATCKVVACADCGRPQLVEKCGIK